MTRPAGRLLETRMSIRSNRDASETGVARVAAT